MTRRPAQKSAPAGGPSAGFSYSSSVSFSAPAFLAQDEGSSAELSQQSVCKPFGRLQRSRNVSLSFDNLVKASYCAFYKAQSYLTNPPPLSPGKQPHSVILLYTSYTPPRSH